MTSKRILLAIDRSPRADAVAILVAKTAWDGHAPVRLLHVETETSEILAQRPGCGVIATEGHNGIGRVLLGGVAERVSAKTSVPVMLVRSTAIDPELESETAG